MAEEEPRLIPAHFAVWYAIAVYHVVLGHVLSRLCCLDLVNPRRVLVPLIGGYEAIRCFA